MERDNFENYDVNPHNIDDVPTSPEEWDLEAQRQQSKQDKIEDASLVASMTQNISTSEFHKAAQHQGNGWSAKSALADAAVETEGYGLLLLMRHIVGSNLLERCLLKSMKTIRRLESLQVQNSDNDYICRMLEEAMVTVSSLPQQAVSDYYDTFNRHLRK